jgi:hypothetical protein
MTSKIKVSQLRVDPLLVRNRPMNTLFPKNSTRPIPNTGATIQDNVLNSLAVPEQPGLELPLPEHSLQTVTSKHSGFTRIGFSNFNCAIKENHVTVTIAGKEITDAPQGLLGRLVRGPSSRQVNLATEFTVGSNECPTWENANQILGALKTMLQVTDGYVNSDYRRAVQSGLAQTRSSVA